MDSLKETFYSMLTVIFIYFLVVSFLDKIEKSKKKFICLIHKKQKSQKKEND